MTQAFNLSQFANKLNSSGQTDNTGLQNSSVTVTAGTGMSGGGAVALGSSVTLTNAGVTSITAGTGISVSGSTGAVTITNTGSGQLLTQVFASSGTWTAPANCTSIYAVVIAGGGGGSGSDGTSGSQGGNGGHGGVAAGPITVVGGTTYTITVGTGGVGNNANNGAGTAGTSSSIGSLISATGGQGGSSTQVSGNNGVGTNGTVTNRSYYGDAQINNYTISVPPFIGLPFRTNATSSTAALAWSTTRDWLPGCGGTGESINNPANATGGVGGAVLIQYIG